MTVSPNLNTTNSMQQNSLKRDDIKDMPQETLNNQNTKIAQKDESQIKSYSTYLGTNIDIRV